MEAVDAHDHHLVARRKSGPNDDHVVLGTGDADRSRRDAATVGGKHPDILPVAATEHCGRGHKKLWRMARSTVIVIVVLSEWALGHRSFILFLMFAAVIAGALAYRELGREEDPSFAVKTMVVVAVWPGEQHVKHHSGCDAVY